MLVVASASCGDNVVLPPDAVIIEPPIPPILSVDPESAHFGSVTAATVSAPAMVTVRNIGQLESGLVTASLGGTDPTSFTFSNGCTTLAPEGTCQIVVRFAPTNAGAKSATLIVTGGILGARSVILDDDGTAAGR